VIQLESYDLLLGVCNITRLGLEETIVAKTFQISALSLLAVVAMSSVAVAEDDVAARIKPVGEVNVAGKTAAAPTPAASSPTPAAASTAAAAPAPAAVTPAAASAAAADPGAALYQAKSCFTCHGADGKTTIMDTYPKIAGQSAEYLFAQMKDIKTGTRSNGQTAVMKGIVAAVSDEDMKTIAEWLSKQ
jgi:cytochrome c553